MKIFGKATQIIHEVIPTTIQIFAQEVDNRIQKILKKKISSMNFISRDEFDKQSQILYITQQKIKQLEAKLNTLEDMYKNLFNIKNNKN